MGAEKGSVGRRSWWWEGEGENEMMPKKRKIANGSDICTFFLFCCLSVFLFFLRCGDCAICCFSCARSLSNLFQTVLSFTSNCMMAAVLLRFSRHDDKFSQSSTPQSKFNYV